MKLKLKQRHIIYGKRGACSCCPLALLMREVFPENREGVTVSWDFFGLNGKWTVPLSYGIRELINRFDEHGVMEPFEIELVENPDKTQKEKPYRILRRIGEER